MVGYLAQTMKTIEAPEHREPDIVHGPPAWRGEWR